MAKKASNGKSNVSGRRGRRSGLNGAPSLAMSSALPLHNPSGDVTITSWGLEKDSARFRHTGNTNEYFTQDPRPLGTNIVTALSVTRFISTDQLRKYDSFRFDHLECWATPISSRGVPICVQIFSAIDPDDSAPVSAGAENIQARSNLSRAVLTNDNPSQCIAKFTPYLMQEGLDVQERILETIRKGHWNDVAHASILKFGAHRAAIVFPLANDSGTAIPSVMFEYRAVITLRGRREM